MSARILVVDDTPLNVKLLAAKLMRDYYIVSTAESGIQALEMVAKEKPDLILLDVMMPDLDGFETCRRLKADETTRHIPVVMVTALSDVADRVKGLEVGADDFLSKPINDIALMARVRSLLRLKMLMDEWRLREATAGHFDFAKQPEPEADPAARILVLEDSEPDAVKIIDTLQSLTTVPLTRVATMAEALTETQAQDYDLVIVSLDLADEDGLILCSQIRANESTRSLPLLLLAMENEIDLVAKGLDLGANDYLLRPLESSELMARARIQLRQKHHHDQLVKNYQRSLELALVDPLTGAYNRRYLDVHLPRMFEKCATNDKPISVLALDIDFFKKVNDTYGHDAGDAVLKEIVARVTQSVRSHDLVARMGGEEFDVIMPGTDLATAQSIGERIREKIAASPVFLPLTQQTIPVTTSIGATTTRYADDKDLMAVLTRADTALLEAKSTGRNKVVSAS